MHYNTERTEPACYVDRQCLPRALVHDGEAFEPSPVGTDVMNEVVPVGTADPEALCDRAYREASTLRYEIRLVRAGWPGRRLPHRPHRRVPQAWIAPIRWEVARAGEYQREGSAWPEVYQVARSSGCSASQRDRRDRNAGWRFDIVGHEEVGQQRLARFD